VTISETPSFKKPTSDKEYEEYKKKVCCKCAYQFNLVRGKSKKGCEVIDLHAMVEGPERAIRTDGVCLFFKSK